jgi:hypothetical protein
MSGMVAVLTEQTEGTVSVDPTGSIEVCGAGTVRGMEWCFSPCT